MSCSSEGGNSDNSAHPGTSATTTAATSSSTTSSSETTTSSTSTSNTTNTASTSTTGAEGSAASSAGVAADKSPASTGTSTQSTQSSNPVELPESVENAYEIFGSLVPRSLFEEFDTCEAVGMQSYYNCTGASVGQFQFTESKSKAVSTLQTLTELRTSQVVYDSGDRVVGWSSLGSTVIITVVSTESGLVMQHMISGDAEEPEQKIKELGLAN
ncbi:beta-N-acetylglucosaminidase [Corynebacterium pseudodiphtheriticum]|uniref:beta-N-acetylglucosaminidase n=1 Tax=Corynebacterium pseudodiphtheriticum TaxID=37637 RepID=UPI00223BD812|nr:beta-N-acetylglucosaminidase [Corynebacterium pseudodiphtheriticum]MCT1635438.1 beta-N-acetylglucosaminidase [Corynebacterium pseudodiphtheriticum]MCT1666446.1 beta-N-acetylglucosaminidase [Corynebacterium pseudodiphtheriticum]